jgi:hypothetical protein
VDPAAHDPVARWLAYGHPALMIVAIGLVFVALRRGLDLRRRRLRGERGRGARIAAHAAIAKPAVILVSLGLVGGLVSAIVVRDWAPLRTFHGWVGVLAAALFAATGFVGWQLLRGRSRAVDAHGWLGLVAFLAAAVAAVAGFVLLP